MISLEFLHLLLGGVALAGIALAIILLIVGWIERNDDPPQPPSGGDKIVQDYDQLLLMLKKEYMRGRASGYIDAQKRISRREYSYGKPFSESN